MLKRILHTTMMVILAPVVIHADPGILPGASQGLGSSNDSFVVLGVIALALLVLTWSGYVLGYWMERRRRPPSSPSGGVALLLGISMLAAPSFAHALESEFAETVTRITASPPQGIDISSVVVIVACGTLICCVLPHGTRRARDREAAPIE